MVKRLTKKEKGFVKDVAKGEPAVKAALKNYDTKSYGAASSIANAAMKKPHIQEALKSIADSIPDDLIRDVHLNLLKSTKMEHMTFPLGPEGEDDPNFSGGGKSSNDGYEEEELNSDDDSLEPYRERTTLTDAEIIEMLKEVNCTVRRIVHGNSARHVYFWAADNMARDKALDKAYKIKGTYAPEKIKMSGEVLFGNYEAMSNDELARLAGTTEDQG